MLYSFFKIMFFELTVLFSCCFLGSTCAFVKIYVFFILPSVLSIRFSSFFFIRNSMTVTMTHSDEVTNKCQKPGPTDMKFLLV